MFLLATQQIFPIRIFLVKQGFFLLGKILGIVTKKKQDFFLVKGNCLKTSATNVANMPDFITFMLLIELNLSRLFVNRDHD